MTLVLSQRVLLLLLFLTGIPSSAVATISYDGYSFESMPAHFGMEFDPPSRQYQAHLQFLKNNPKLCEEPSLMDDLILPDGIQLPVALLVERGVCSFEQKASVAMQAYPAVSFMIVYDDQLSNNLVSMRETNSGHGIALGMLFVSHRSGMTLRAMLENRTDEEWRGLGGPIVELNGLDPIMLHEPSLKDLQTWILIAMGGFFTFITVFGCLLVFVQLGVIPVNGAGQIILSPEAIRRSRRLLTTEEVSRLKVGGDLFGKRAFPLEDDTQQTLPEVPSSGDVASNMDNDGCREAPGSIASNSQDDGGLTVEVHTVTVNPLPDPAEEDRSCAVCLDELVYNEDGNEQDATLYLPCRHHFHVECIVPWLTERHATCPLCKFDVLKFIMDIDEQSSTKKESRMRSSLSWCKEQGSRLMRLGWSPVQSSESTSETSTNEDAPNRTTLGPSDRDNEATADNNNTNNNTNPAPI